MTDQDKVAAFLKAHVGFHFCSFCLSREVGIDSFIARNVVWELQGFPGYQMRTTKCVRALQTRHHGRGRPRAARPGSARGRLSARNACLAFANEISLDDAQRVTAFLQPLPEFERLAPGECSVCARTAKPVISAMGPARDEAGRDHNGNAVESIGASTLHYRGWRIDVLSYRVATGWRPFIVVHGPTENRGARCGQLVGPDGDEGGGRRLRSRKPRTGSTSASEVGVSLTSGGAHA